MRVTLLAMTVARAILEQSLYDARMAENKLLFVTKNGSNDESCIFIVCLHVAYAFRDYACLSGVNYGAWGVLKNTSGFLT